MGRTTSIAIWSVLTGFFPTLAGPIKLPTDNVSSPFVGISSLLRLPDQDTILAGHQRGTVFALRGETSGTTIAIDSVLRHDDASAYPIFALTTARTSLLGDEKNHNTWVVCGGGDRYVSVWSRRHNKTWQREQRLGPHTGWVKDVCYNEEDEILYSIGCNCIECWKYTTNGWIHWKKIAMESCPRQGATLSSDILCLCYIPNILVAAGVDGRVHLFDSASMTNPIHSFLAHHGRVNVIQYAKESRLVVTGSHDGLVKFWKVTSNNVSNTKIEQLAEYRLQDNQRVTALCIIQDTPFHHVKLAVGTQKGNIFSLIFSKDEHSDGKTFHVAEESFSNNVKGIVYAFCPIFDRLQLLIGHSMGLDVIDF